MYSREANGRIITFGASGWTYQNTFVLYDLETRSLWFGGPGLVGTGVLTCVAG